MGDSNSAFGSLWDGVKSLAAIAAVGWVAWYAYSNWESAPSSVGDSMQGTTFNCRTALAELASDYACMSSDACSMTDEEQTDLKKREADIEKYCN